VRSEIDSRAAAPAMPKFGGTTDFFWKMRDGLSLEDVPRGTRQVLGLCGSRPRVIFDLYERLVEFLCSGETDPNKALESFHDMVWRPGQQGLRRCLAALSETESESRAVVSFFSIFKM
jgi:hypothetical protein